MPWVIFNRITHHGFAADFTAAGLRIGCHHYPELAGGLAASGQYDMVCCGHNHESKVERFGDCLLINPGDLLGKDDLPGFILLATRDLSWERIIVGKRLDIDNG